MEKHAKEVNPGMERVKRAINEARRIAAADPRSHEALDANRLGQKYGREKMGFYVSGTLEFDKLGIVYGFLANDHQVRVGAEVRPMVCKTTMKKHSRAVAASMCNQSIQHYLRKCNETVTQNVTMRHLVSGQAILVALVHEGKGIYRLQSIYEPDDAATLAIAGVLHDLLNDSKCEVARDDEFDFVFEDSCDVSAPALPDATPLENVVHLLANKDYLRQQIRAITGAEDTEVTSRPTMGESVAYDSGMPLFIDKDLYEFYEHLQTHQGTTELEQWIDLHPTSMSLDEYRDWLFTPAGENMLDQFWPLEDDSPQDAPEPVASKPVASAPVASKPVASAPVASKPVAPVASVGSTSAAPVCVPSTASGGSETTEDDKDNSTIGGAAFMESEGEFHFREGIDSPMTVVDNGDEFDGCLSISSIVPDAMLFGSQKEDTRRTKGEKQDKSGKSGKGKGKGKSGKGSGKKNRDW
jgi:hypothetical protein